MAWGRHRDSTGTAVTLDQTDPLVGSLRAHRLRLTPQRLAIARALQATQGHPTVQEVHAAVGVYFPTMSLTTVYNTLRSLVAAGVISELPFARGVRYDSDPTPHVNLVCSECGRILDAHEYDTLLRRLSVSVRRRNDFSVEGQRFDFYGHCDRCTRLVGRRRGSTSPSTRQARPTPLGQTR
jgi:Fur family peroxide stress response transcriptional regulator